jgi:hypothetical protein
MLACSDTRTVIRFRSRGFFHRKGIYMQMDTFARNPASGFRVVEVTVWSNDGQVQGRELTRRAILLIRFLKAHLMATDKDALRSISAERVRAEILG